MQILSPGDIVFLFMKFQFHLNTFFFIYMRLTLFQTSFTRTQFSLANMQWSIGGGEGGGGGVPSKCTHQIRNFYRMFKMVDYAESISSCVYWFENSI